MFHLEVTALDNIEEWAMLDTVLVELDSHAVVLVADLPRFRPPRESEAPNSTLLYPERNVCCPRSV